MLETAADSNYEEVKHTVETPFTMEHNVAYSTTTHTSTTAAHKIEVETDSNYEEVKHTVETPFTMKHNMAYSTTATTNL